MQVSCAFLAACRAGPVVSFLFQSKTTNILLEIVPLKKCINLKVVKTVSKSVYIFLNASVVTASYRYTQHIGLEPSSQWQAGNVCTMLSIVLCDVLEIFLQFSKDLNFD